MEMGKKGGVGLEKEFKDRSSKLSRWEGDIG